ncbi:hypothetical protein QOZ95_002876 [Paenibacillus brasilensis]|uniref:Uncharacterized protein n=1 Tax=Paenibacillus brasilensis TaxID=128574 RepID=A0ABU0L1I8_9BACL|nr:hypothetical protein [Paenibacillus brasilensis]
MKSTFLPAVLSGGGILFIQHTACPVKRLLHLVGAKVLTVFAFCCR